MSEKQPIAKPARVPVKKVRLRISYIDPLSAVKTSFVLSIVFGIAMVFAIIFIWYLLNLSGSLDAATGLVSDVFGIYWWGRSLAKRRYLEFTLD
jgi:hypothetical protein